MGKTRLAVETAAAQAEAFPDGAWLVELGAPGRPAGLVAPVPSPSPAGEAEGTGETDVAELVTAALGIHDDAPAGPLAAWLAAALRTRHMLLVLDNCECLIGGVAGLAERLLQAAPGLRILATSQEPLAIHGEQLCEVPPLELPDPSASGEPTLLAKAGAVQLFVARAAAAAPGFTLDVSNARAITVICRRLDGIPLALELAAARVRALGVHELAARLDDRFRLLAAEEVCAGHGVERADIANLLARLVDRSLVVVTGGAGEPRYRLLESVAAYGVERLREAGELERVQRRHRQFYTTLAERARPHLRGHGQRQWLERLDRETANVHSALDGTIRHREAHLALRLAGAMTWYWFLRGRLTEARRALEAALAIEGDAPAAARAFAIAWQAGITLLVGGGGLAEHACAALKLYKDIDDPAAGPPPSGSSASPHPTSVTCRPVRTWSTGRRQGSAPSATDGESPRR